MSSVGRACRTLAKLATLLGLIAVVQSKSLSGQVAPPAVQVPAKVQGQAIVAPTPAQDQKQGEFSDAITLPSDRKIRLQLEAARDDYIKREHWAEASKLLQAILNRKEDVFVQVSRKGADGQEKTRWVSARAEANRLLATLAAKGLPFYEVLYGGEGKAKLAEAKKSGDPQQLAEVAQRFFHTQAGAEATDLLGTYHLDRGRPLIAALCYKRLLEREDADQLLGLTLYKAALAFRMAGNQANMALARQAWDKLAAKVGGEGLRIGDDVVTVEQLKEEVDRAAPPEAANLYDWPMFRGNASRSGEGLGSAPFLDSKWQISTMEDPLLQHEAKHWIELALRQRHIKTDPLLPAFCPIAAGGKLLFRSYWGIHAVDSRTGALLWNSLPLMASLNALAGEVEYRRQVDIWRNLYAQGNNQNVLFENSSVGTLSTDESRVYAVDDLALPPYPGNQMNAPWGGWNGTPITGKLAEMASRSRLVAFDLDSGKLVWERGDPQADTSELAGSYFLGPPLPLGGKLYVLTEKNSELRLVCLESAKGDVSWSQTLATARDRLLNDVNRRMNAVQLAYAEGILVCPTNAGTVLGVDLLSRSLVWAFPYRERTNEPDSSQALIGGMGRRGFPMRGVMAMGNPNGLQRLNSEWKMAAPIIAEGKVVFTAPDGGAIHCLNLQDGDSLWQAERRDDLYLAGVFHSKVVLVGKNGVRALSLTDGKKQLWQTETGAPSGLGVASGHYYYLPLRKGDGGEVCRIDLEKGQVDARSPSPRNEIPGNLLFYDGDVISQTVTGVTAYEQVDAKVAQIDTLLKKNPHDPVALTDRGEMRLYKGDLAGAVADLRDALANNPPQTSLPRTRAKLYATLTDLLQRDFATAENYLAEYKDLCQVTIPANATTEERDKLKEEQKRRMAGYLCLLAKGREGQGRVLDAFQAYLEFGQLANNELMPVINEPTVRARPHVWAQGRIQSMLDKANAQQRDSLETEISRRWQELRKKGDIKALREFATIFGSLCNAGREATLLLAERDMEGNRFLEAELQLDQLRAQRDDPRMAARALEALARLMAKKGLMEDAVYFYRMLRQDYANTVVRDEKTGLAVYNELAADKRLLPYLDDLDPPLLSGEVHAKMIMEPSPILNQQAIRPYELHGEFLPFYSRFQLAWTPRNINGMGGGTFEFKLLNRNDSQVIWTLSGSPTKVADSGSMTNSVRYPCYLCGHLAVAYLGPTIVGLDLVNHKELWKHNLLDTDSIIFEQPYVHPLLSIGPGGKLLLFNSQGGTQRLGQIGPVNSSYVALRTVEGLVAIDPLTGETLWTKSDLAENTEIFGDDRCIYLVDAKGGKRASNAQSVRGKDGGPVQVPDYSTFFADVIRTYDGRLLLKQKSDGEQLVVRLYDVRTGKDLWKKMIPSGSVILRTEDPALAAVVEPRGALTAVNLRTAKEVLHAQVDPSYLDSANDGLLLEDRNFFFAIFNRTSNQNISTVGTNFGTMKAERVDGTIYAFRRESGKRAWLLSASKQMLLVERFAELPIIILSSRYQEPVQNMTGMQLTRSLTMTVDKNTGKRIYMPDPASTSQAEMFAQFHALRIDKQAGVIDLVSRNMTLRHWVTHGKAQRSSTPTAVVAGSLGSGNGLFEEGK